MRDDVRELINALRRLRHRDLRDADKPESLSPERVKLIFWKSMRCDDALRRADEDDRPLTVALNERCRVLPIC